MCIGVPMQVRAVLPSGAALCGTSESGGPVRPVEASLLDGAPHIGDWLLVHLDVAIRALDAAEARQIGDALQALVAAAAGEPFEHLIADLVEREPQLPPHLREEATGDSGNG